MSRMPWIVASLVLIGLAGLWVVLPKLHRFAYWIDRKPADHAAKLAVDGWQALRVTAAPGEELHGLLRPPSRADAGWVLFLPGNSSDLLAGFRQVLDPVVKDDPRGFVFCAWRGFDSSGGTPSPAAFAQDVAAVWGHLQGLGARAADVEVWSYSLGTAMAVDLVAGWCRNGTPPRRLVVLSGYDVLPVMAAGTFGRVLPGDRHDALASAPAVTCPVLLVHGEHDDALPLDGARRLAQAFGGPARLLVMPGKGHSDWLGELRTVLAQGEREAQAVRGG